MNLPTTHQELRELLVDEIIKRPGFYGFPDIDKIGKKDLRLMHNPDQLPCI